MSLEVWVGYDPREHLTYQTFVASLRETSPGLVIHKLDAQDLRQRGLFSRPWEITAEGQFLDKIDGKPFSTHFAHTRFLVPHLARERNVEHALFIDGDFIALSDVRLVLNEINSSSAVSVVKHNFSESGIKMDNKQQVPYARKLWSSFMLFNARNPYCQDLTPDAVNTKSGSYLHRFEWCPDNAIGALSEGWNYIPAHSEKHYQDTIHMIHYTRGTPEMPKYRKGPMTDIWYEALVRGLKNG